MKPFKIKIIKKCRPYAAWSNSFIGKTVTATLCGDPDNYSVNFQENVNLDVPKTWISGQVPKRCVQVLTEENK